MTEKQDIFHLDFLKAFEKEFPDARLHLVGGSVRDMILGISVTDFDMVAEGIPQDDLIHFLEKHGKVVSVLGRTFGVIKFKPKPPLVLPPPTTPNPSSGRRGTAQAGGGILDIALPRRERYLAGGRRKNAEVEYENVTIDDDLARRDFTINAMALPFQGITNYQLPITNQIGIHKFQNGQSVGNWKLEIKKLLIDPFGGLCDLEKGVIRAVGNPSDRFLEDPTRILRGVRFAVRFNFQIETETLKAMQQLAPEILKTFIDDSGREIERVSWEVIGAEFIKTFEINPVRTIELYDEVGLLRLILPEIAALQGVLQPPEFHDEGDVFVHTLMALGLLPVSASLELKLATLFHDIGKPETFQSVAETGDRIRFNDHDKVGQEKFKLISRRFHWSNKLCDQVSWIIEKHMDLFFAFLRMKRDKQKAFVRHPGFPDLLELGRVDTMASLRPGGRVEMGVYPEVARIAAEIIEEDQHRPREIIDGKEIIQILQAFNEHFDPSLEGKTVGDIKKKINSLYDRGEIKNKVEAGRAVTDEYTKIKQKKA